MTNILVISLDTIPIQNHLAAGTGIRSWEVARGLAKYGHDVTIAVPKECYDSDIEEYSGVKIKTWDYENVISLCDDAEAVFIPQGDAFFSNFFVEHIRDDLCIIVDVYDPNLIESLNLFQSDTKGIKSFSDYLMGIVPVLKRGDFFVCASHRQRYYYLGVLNVLGRINPLTYNEKLIEIVPFGVPDEDPFFKERNNVMRGSLVNNEDLVILWFGGIYPWFDAITLIKAIDIAVKKNPTIKLVIMGAVHPRGHAPPDNYIKTLELSKQLDLYSKNVFFTEWRPYDERIYWYREADIGICTFPMHLETELSNRTRVVDMLWGGLPVITTEGDELSTLIKQYNCGATVKPDEPEELAEVLLDILGNNEKRKMMAENTRKFAERFRWANVLKPLAEFLNNPVIAKDRRDEFTAKTLLCYVDTLERHRAYIPTEKELFEKENRKKEQYIDQLNQGVNQLNLHINDLNQQINQLSDLNKIKDNRLRELDITITEINKTLLDIHSSLTWQTVMKFQKLVEKLLPPETRRRRFYDYLLINCRAILNGRWKTIFNGHRESSITNIQIFEHFEASENEVKLKKENSRHFKYQPLISIVMPVYNTEERWLIKALDSVFNQIYENWELCIVDDASPKKHIRELLSEYAKKDVRIKVKYLEKNKNISGSSNEALSLATGEFVAFLDHDDELSNDALYEIVKLLNEHPDADIIYSDDDKIDEKGNGYDIQYKPDWSPELLLSYCYFSHIKVLRKTLLEEIGGFRLGYEGSQDYDLVLRAVENSDKIYHIPKILYHWRSIPGSVAYSAGEKPTSIEVGRKAVEDAIRRRGISGEAVIPEFAQKSKVGIYKINFKLKDEPKISIIIPTKDKLDLLKRCVSSIENRTKYRNYEIVIVDTGSKEKETLEYLNTTKHIVLKIRLDKFNFSRINNYAVSKVNSEFVLLLNNDTEVISENWLNEMLGYMLSDPKIGAVGAKLIYKDKRVQHAGVVLGLNNGLAGHANKLIHCLDGGYLNYALVARNFSAVTAACFLTRKKYYEEVGGLDENNFAVAYNDVDFCLKLIQKGYRIVFNPYALLYHDEGGSRGTGAGNDNPVEEEFFKNKWGYLLKKGDPYYNPNLSLEDEMFKIKKKSSDTKNLLFISYNLNLEGAPFSQFYLARGLKNKGYNIKILSVIDGPLKNYYLDLGIDVDILKAPLDDKNVQKEITSLIKSKKYRLAYINTIVMYQFVDLISSIGIPAVWSIRESEKEYYFSTLKDLGTRTFKNADAVVFASHATRKIYSDLEYNGNFHTIHNGIDLSEIDFFKKNNNKSDLRRKYGFPGDCKIVTVVGTTCERKGQKVFVDAAIKLLQNADNLKIHFLVVGAREGEYLENLKKMIESSNTSANIHLIPETRSVFDYYLISDIFICSSFIESLPRVILEAMAFELPIISTNVFGIPEEIEDGKSGILIEPDDAQLLASRIKFLLENDQKANECSKEAYNRVNTIFSMKKMVDKYEKLFNEASG